VAGLSSFMGPHYPRRMFKLPEITYPLSVDTIDKMLAEAAQIQRMLKWLVVNHSRW